MNKVQEFRKQTEEAKFEAFSLMCKKVAELEKENAELEVKIEKMKNCKICSHNYSDGCSYHRTLTRNCLEYNHKYFELKEIKEK